MRSATKKEKKVLDLDSRNRVTLPKELTTGVDFFSWQRMDDGTIKLIPQHVISEEDNKLLASLKRSAADYKAGRVKRIPQSWLDNDDEKL
jgi:hypothetical protein